MDNKKECKHEEFVQDFFSDDESHCAECGITEEEYRKANQ